MAWILETEWRCQNCGRELTSATMRYCGAECRRLAARRFKLCHNCGRVFVSTMYGQKFCQLRCRKLNKQIYESDPNFKAQERVKARLKKTNLAALAALAFEDAHVEPPKTRADLAAFGRLLLKETGVKL